MSKYVQLFVVRNWRSMALYTPVPVDFATAMRICETEWRRPNRHGVWTQWVGYGIPYVGVFRL